ncbi:murein biosynthesis integral membrane protein MurJ [Humisphaera borealis]|uniref:Probable lipid II flippase MurJ n=1 Tax=Humisphaera borealis TaxID=2807512 RepID=A0A7M2X137_9BACT|nr:murein biosynthesis integral membrane protein MurJ [Humisphaera borealis]QOV90450.1 murein biosynthesis integral membrane protein MurJ [Humisphaera borealis]
MSQPSSFLRHAKVVGLLTLASRVLGLGREIVSAHFLGTGLIASAFTVAFTIPNLFRKLFGEGALSAAFIPLYARAVKDDRTSAADFAASGINLLVAILLAITILGELLLVGILALWPGLRADHLLTLRLTAIMLPYVLLICGMAFLSGILQVHRRFAAPAAAPILLNLCHIAVLVIGAATLGLSGRTDDDRAAELQTSLVYWLAFAVLVAGVLQTAILLPSLRAVGFRFRLAVGLWTPMTRNMFRLTIPVALGAGVVQLSVLLDRSLSTLLMAGVDAAGNQITHFSIFGQVLRYPMEAGAPARLAVAQFMYLFPLGIFATALATAIFPSLSSDALEKDQSKFKASLRQGIEAALWEGIPASVGLILVSEPAIRLLFQHGQITAHDADLIRHSLIYYAAAIWAFSLLQITSRAFYAVHDTATPLKLAILNLVINLAVELPMIWVLGEAGMAVGTLVAFTVQAIWMLRILDRRVGGLELTTILRPVLKMFAATALMTLVCWGVSRLPIYPTGDRRWVWAAQLAILIVVGGAAYGVGCRLLGVTVMDHFLPRRFRRR